MRRSVRVELRNCHKVHLPPQISLSFDSIPRELLAKCQHCTRFIAAGPFQELCTVDCPLPFLGEKWPLLLCRAYHVSLFDFQRLEHVFLKTAIGHHCAGAGLDHYVLGPQSLSQRRALHALPLLEFCGPALLLTSLGIHFHARLPDPIIWSAIQLCCQPRQPQRCHISCTPRLGVTARLHQQKGPHEV